MKVIRQRDFKDCGVTCLEYIIDFYGGYVPIEKLREDTYTNKNGTTAYHLVETLKKYGFDSFGQKVRFKELESVPKPCIVHLILSNGMNHFAILFKVKEEKVILMDPAFGKRKIAKEEFSGIWDGVVLLALPNTIIPKIPKEKSVIIHLLNFTKKEWTTIFPIVLFSIFTSFLSIFTSFYFKIGMEESPFLNSKELWHFMIYFAVLYILKMLFEYAKNYWHLYLEKNIEIEYMYSFLLHLFKLPLKKWETYQEGEILTRVEEAKEIKELFYQVCITIFLEGILGLCSLIVLGLVNKTLSLIVMVGIILYLGISLMTSKSFYHFALKNMEVEQKWNESLLEHIRLYPTVKHLNETAFALERVEDTFCTTLKEKRKIKQHAMLHQFIKNNYLEGLFFLVTTLGILFIKQGKLTLLDFITFQNLYFYFIAPFKELGDIGPQCCYVKSILRKISETMNWTEEELGNVEVELQVSSIEVKNLAFSYNQMDPIFENINFKIEEKEHIFLDGPSGCGKSTFCKILHREEEIYKGEILISQKSIKDYELSVIRSGILYLSQQESLISGTIKENILFGSMETKKFDEIVNICEIESIVAKRPFRYETNVNEENLSGGERQRLLLARILMKDGSVYILDECLSEVEKKLERKIIKQIREFLKEKIVIYISHTDNSKLFERKVIFESTKYLE